MIMNRVTALGGASASQLFARVAEAESALQESRAENERLEAYLAQIMAEIQAKAPLIAEQRRDYERALASHNDLSERLGAAARTNEALEAQLREAAAAKASVEREKAALEQEVADLARQVRLLLKEQLNIGGGGGGGLFGAGAAATPIARRALRAVSPPSAGAAVTPATAASRDDANLDADAVISEHLVSFKDVSQLQSRNQQLLRVVRQLTAERKAEIEASQQSADRANKTALKVTSLLPQATLHDRPLTPFPTTHTGCRVGAKEHEGGPSEAGAHRRRDCQAA